MLEKVLLLLLALGAAAPLLVTLAARAGGVLRRFGTVRHLENRTKVSQIWRLCPRVGATVLLLGVTLLTLWRWELLDVALERPQWVSSVVLLVHAALPLFAAFSATRLVVEGLVRPATTDHSYLLFLLLGVWTWLPLWQRMQATAAPLALEHVAQLQRALLGLLLAMGSWDLLGTDALAYHGWAVFGTLRSAHWFLGLLQVQALECQLQLVTLLRQREVLLHVLGATHMMGLAILLFLGGITASVGFLVSRKDFLHFVETLAPPPRITAAIVMLRRENAVCALALGGAAGFLWQLPPGDEEDTPRRQNLQR
ncbi:ATP-grasp domain-containing protein [Durusdinium trenchii]|uniref:ATP-grasp domain-containing protein n=1 Tax=Durusdinium trenchii TaxID=1381693 RepID=A0ABP0SAS2_9DINO